MSLLRRLQRIGWHTRLHLADRHARRYYQSHNLESLTPVQKALHWFHAHHLPGGGIRVHSHHPNPYAEVTGYIVPTLIEYGEDDFAVELLEWLLRVQTSEGAFTDPDGGQPYIFDTGQVLRGLVAGNSLFAHQLPSKVDSLRRATERAADYLLNQMVDDGRGGFGIRYSAEEKQLLSETIHLYVLPPLVEAGHLLHKTEYENAAHRCAEYYLKQSEVLDINRLTHFLAYEMEALIDLGLADKTLRVLDALCELQAADGSVRGVGNEQWVCTPGLAQIAICWFKTDQSEPANRAVGYLEKQQRAMGGWLGSYGVDGSYFPDAELSWAVKYYLDAKLLQKSSQESAPTL